MGLGLHVLGRSQGIRRADEYLIDLLDEFPDVFLIHRWRRRLGRQDFGFQFSQPGFS
jgi:hypothetical protein